MATRNNSKSLSKFVSEQVEVAKERLEGAQKALVALETKAQKRLVALASEAEDTVEDLLAKGKTQRKELIAAFEKQLNAVQAKVLDAAGFATRSQLKELSREVNRLNKKVDALVGHKAA